MSTFTNKKLANPIALPVAATVFYTVPANTTTIVSAVTIASTVVATVSMYLVPVGGVADGTNILLPTVPIGGATLVANFNFGQTISAGDSIQVVASVAGAVSFHCSGIEIS